MNIHQVYILIGVLISYCTAQSSDTCSSVPLLVRTATAESEQITIARSLLARSTETAKPGEESFRRVIPSLDSTYQLLAQRAGLKESPITFSAFVTAIQEISIAKTEACMGASSMAINETELIHEFQTIYQKPGRDSRALRSIVGKLLCMDSLDSQEGTNPAGPTSLFRTKRQSECPPRDRCSCPANGILGDNLLCTCEFFECLDQGNVLRDVVFGLKDDECIVFVIDTTGSMGKEIRIARRLILQFVRLEEEIGEYGCYILVPFNDVGPNNKIVAEKSVGPIVIAETALIGDLQDFYRAVEALKADGGNDEPEYSLYAMLQGLRANINGFDYVVAGSQMVVITDATTKQPELKDEVIQEANARNVCIHFFLSAGAATSSPIYLDVASRTSGNLINGFSDWQLATFTQSYKDNPCRHVRNRINKRQAPQTSSRCQSFNITEFSVSLKTTIQGTTGGQVTMTRPNQTSTLVEIGEGNIGLYTELNPTPGQWEACVNTGNIELRETSKFVLDSITVYFDEQGNMSMSGPTTACTRGKIAVITPQARKISNAILQFVNELGVVEQAVDLESCDGMLVSKSTMFPQGSFIYHISGSDSLGTEFTYNTEVNATFAGCTFTPSFNLLTDGNSDIIIRRGQLSSIQFMLTGNTNRIYRFNLSSPVMSGFRTRILPNSVEISKEESVEITVLVTVSSSRVSSGTVRTLTLVASSGDSIITATRRIVVKNAEETYSSCGCQNGGKCTFIRGRNRCRCVSGYSGLKCERRL